MNWLVMDLPLGGGFRCLELCAITVAVSGNL